MNDPGKYVRLFILLFLSMLCFLIVVILLMLALRLFSGLVDQLPWTTYLYNLFVLSVPAAIFITAFGIFSLRTRSYHSLPVRIVSWCLLLLFLGAWIVQYIMDLVNFFRTSERMILGYRSWDLIFLVASVACLFIVGIIQALAASKEEDWLQRNKRKVKN